MANGQVDFYNMLSGLGDTIAKQRTEAARKQAFADINNPDGTVDFQKAIMGLTRAGDVEGAARISQLAGQIEDRKFRQSTDARDFAHRQLESQRSQQNADRSYGLQERNAGAEKWVLKEAPDGSGFVRFNARTGEMAPVAGATGTAQPGNPFSAGGKFNEGQGKAAGFTDRMLQSEGILSGVAVPEGYQGPTTPGVQDQGKNVAQAGLSKIPGVGNYLISNERQKFEQAKRDFINAQLRRESGAAISPTEFESADKQYFPVPGDKPEVIKQKEANRRAAIEALGREGGPSYRPKANFAPDGGVRPIAAAPASGRPISKAQYDALPSGTPFTAPDGSQRVKP
jgi:hypothetical protein